MMCVLAGNKETLLSVPLQRNQDTREELLKFHDRYYSSNVMALTLLGKGRCQRLNQPVVIWCCLSTAMT